MPGLQTKPDQNDVAEELSRLRRELNERSQELSEAHQQQLATAEVLKAISRSHFDLPVVLNTLVESATRLCGAHLGQIFRWDGSLLRWAAGYALSPEFLATQRERVYRLGRDSAVGRTALNMRVTVIDDALADPEYAYKDHARIGDIRTILGIPLIRSGELIGVLALVHQQVKPFTDRQIELVTTFADQAVIAIENARLFEALQGRNHELTETLEQQTATGTILRAIAASPTDVKPVLSAVAQSAAKLCDAYDAAILLADGDRLVLRAHHGSIPIDIDTWPITRDWITARAYIDRKPIHVHDALQEKDEFPASHALATRLGFRTILAVPMLREDKAIGALFVRRDEARPFNQKQIDLLVIFADQAAIAIENARLFEELQARNRELTEALEQQTATGTILRTIAASPTEVGPVLTAVAESATRLCEAYDAVIFLQEGNMLIPHAHHGPIPLDVARWPIGRDSVSGRAYIDCKPAHVHDVIQEETEFPASHAVARRLGFHTILAVPLLRQDKAIGVVLIRRREVRPFTQKQIDLLALFADQAAIAIANTRLFEELQARNHELTEALEQQTATGAILRTIAASPTDVGPVLNSVAESAARLCEAYDAALLLAEGDTLALRAHYGPIPIDFARWPVGRDWVTGRAYVDRKPVHVHDLMQRGDEFPAGHAMAERLGHRTILAVPLLREDKAIGSLVIRRREVRPFSEKQIELVVLLADQAAIAIENTRLFEELETRNRELTEALEQQTATGTILRAIAASPTDVRPVLNAVVESAARLCGAANGQIYRWDGSCLRWAAGYALSPEFRDTQVDRVYQLGPDSLSGRTALNMRVTVIDDAWEDPEYGYKENARIGNFRTMLGVPLLRSGELIGVLGLTHEHVEPFTDRQIELVTTFADQAVIAIENTRLFEALEARNRELTEAIERQTATAEVLKAISRATFDLPAVLRTLVGSAARLCGASYGGIMLREGDMLRVRALYGGTPQDEADLQSRLAPIDRSRISGRVILSGHIEHIPDVLSDRDYHAPLPRVWNARALMGVPLLSKARVEGVFFLGRPEPGTFPQHQTDLVQTFADQAVIAIENVRLLEEVQSRTRELQESLDYQTAIGEVLDVISRSPSDVQPVFDAIVETAVRLCDADSGTVARERDGEFVFSTQSGFSPEFAELLKRDPIKLTRGTISGRTLLEGKVVHILDVATDPEYTWTAAKTIGRLHTGLGVPLLRDKNPVGVIALARHTVRPFTEKQIELVTTFANQAVIAIENARLFEQVQARTRELQETLDYQTAISEVLNVISRSPSDVQPVLDVILQTAVRLCDADGGTIARERDRRFFRSGQVGFSTEFMELMAREPVEPSRGTITGRTLIEGKVVQILDAEADPDYTWREAQQLGQLRTLLGVPLLRDKAVIGVIALIRRSVRPFTDKQIELVTTFADQAVIAIENARLFQEVQTRTSDLARSVEELQALGEVSQSVNSTLDLKTVLETIVTKAVQLSRTDAGAIYVYSRQADRFRLRATYGMSPELIAAISHQAIRLEDPGMGDAARARQPIQTEDLAENLPTPVHKIVLEAGFHSVLVVPLLRPNKVVGALVVRRRAPGRFSEATVRLMETFAAQSVLAIQNARLFSEVEEKGHQLEVASRHKSQFLANMSHELRTPLNSVLGFTEMLSDGLYGELPDKAKATLVRVGANGRHLLGLINDVLDLSKIEAGQLTMSLEDYSIGQVVRTVAVTTEPLARAKGLTLTANVDEGLPLGRGDERRLHQVLLNLAGNAVKFTEAGSIEIAATMRDGKFEILVRDTGPGIALEHQTRIFEEFQQVDDSNTRQKGGTGLGLAISKRIVEMHGGSIGVESTPGLGSVFKVVIPVRAGEGVKAA